MKKAFALIEVIIVIVMIVILVLLVAPQYCGCNANPPLNEFELQDNNAPLEP